MEDDTFKRILQDKQFHLVQIKAEQKEIIQNVLERKDSMTVLPTGFGKSMCYVLPFWTRYYIVDHILFLMVICNSLLLLKSLPINVINCIKLYVNCSALTGAYDWQ
jgi:ATP-dependent DNA helicase RecQ